MTVKPLFQPTRISGQDRPKPGTSSTASIQDAVVIQVQQATPIIAETSTAATVFKPVSVKALADAGISSQRVANLLVSFNSPTAILEYGQDIMTEISTKSDKFLDEVKDADVAFVETQLMSIISMAQKFHLTPVGGKQGGNFFSGLISKVKENFVDAKEAGIKILNADTNEEIAFYDLDETFSVETAVQVGSFFKTAEGFTFQGVGAGYVGLGLGDFFAGYSN